MAFPQAFDATEVVELSSEPLTLFLLALAGYHKKEFYPDGANTSVSVIYREILLGLYKRDLERNAHSAQGELSFYEFFRALQVIGFASWFTTERSTTRKQLVAVLREYLPQDVPIFERFEKDIDEGAMKMLLAAHIRLKKTDEKSEEIAYEFSHKTFGEFLATECLWRQLRQIVGSYIRRDLSIHMTGRRVMNIISDFLFSPDLKRFLSSTMSICDERCTNGDDLPSTAHDRHLENFHDGFLAHMIKLSRREGMPVSPLEQRYADIARKQSNADETLVGLRGTVVEAMSSGMRRTFRTPTARIISEESCRNDAVAVFLRGSQKVSCLSDLKDLSVSSANVTDSHFSGQGILSRVRDAVFRDVAIEAFQVNNANWENVMFERCVISRGQIMGGQGARRSLNEWMAHLRRVAFVGCSFEDICFAQIGMLDVGFNECNFRNVTMVKCEFARSRVQIDSKEVVLSGCAWIPKREVGEQIDDGDGSAVNGAVNLPHGDRFTRGQLGR